MFIKIDNLVAKDSKAYRTFAKNMKPIIARTADVSDHIYQSILFGIKRLLNQVDAIDLSTSYIWIDGKKIRLQLNNFPYQIQILFLDSKTKWSFFAESHKYRFIRSENDQFLFRGHESEHSLLIIPPYGQRLFLEASIFSADNVGILACSQGAIEHSWPIWSAEDKQVLCGFGIGDRENGCIVFWHHINIGVQLDIASERLLTVVEINRGKYRNMWTVNRHGNIAELGNAHAEDKPAQ